MTTKSDERQRQQRNKVLNRLFAALIAEPVDRWYLRHLELHGLTAEQHQSVYRQAYVGWLQTLLLAIVLVQGVFAGLLRSLPPDLRASLSFLHRIEWAVYVAIVLIAAQVASGWTCQIVLTNRFYALAWRIGRPRLIAGTAAHAVHLGYLLLIFLLAGAIVWVRLHGFVVQPTT
jgi:hypothetical protein